jgi:hypothetical protein
VLIQLTIQTKTTKGACLYLRFAMERDSTMMIAEAILRADPSADSQKEDEGRLPLHNSEEIVKLR